MQVEFPSAQARRARTNLPMIPHSLCSFLLCNPSTSGRSLTFQSRVLGLFGGRGGGSCREKEKVNKLYHMGGAPLTHLEIQPLVILYSWPALLLFGAASQAASTKRTLQSAPHSTPFPCCTRWVTHVMGKDLAQGFGSPPKDALGHCLAPPSGQATFASSLS